MPRNDSKIFVHSNPLKNFLFTKIHLSSIMGFSPQLGHEGSFINYSNESFFPLSLKIFHNFST